MQQASWTARRFAASWSCLIATFALGPLAVHAQPADAVSEEIYVYGRSLEATLPQELTRYGSDLVSLGRSGVEENVYVDPQQMLQMKVPGLHIAPSGPFSYSYVTIQGSRIARYGPSDVLWLVDGVRLNNRLYSSTLSDTLPGNMVERIEVLKGGESLFYGTNAAGGVINIVSRDFSDTFSGDVSTAGDTNESYTVAGMVRGPAGPGNFVLFASKDESEGYRLWDPVEPSATDRRQSYDVWNIGAKFGLDVTPDLRFVAQYQHTDGDIDNIRAIRTNRASNDRNEEIASVRIDYTPGDAAQLFLKGYYHDWDTRYTTINNVVGSPGETVVSADNLYWGYDDYGINALGKFRLHDGVEYLVGYDYQRYSAQDEVWQILPVSESVHAVFGQVRTTEDLIGNGALSAGVRYNDSGEASATVWNVSGKYDFTDELYVQGTISTNFVLPNAEQLFLNEPGEPAGNPALDPEESLNINGSVGVINDDYYWQITGFWRDFDNVIVGDYDIELFVNSGSATIKGFEILGGVSLTDAWYAEASYTHARARLEGQDRQMDYNPRSHAKASLTWDRGRYGATLAGRWVGNVHANAGGGFGVVDFGNYVVADLSAFYYVDRDQRHQLAARLENIFDEEYATVRAFRPETSDAGGSFLSRVRGTPITLHLSYRYKF